MIGKLLNAFNGSILEADFERVCVCMCVCASVTASVSDPEGFMNNVKFPLKT